MTRLWLCLLMSAFALSATAPASAVPIDDFTDPGVVPAGGGQVQTNTDAFGIQGGEPFTGDGCPTRTRTAWWSVRGNGLPITVATTASTFDAIVAAYDSEGVTLGPRLACDGDQPGNLAAIRFNSSRGRRYLVQVGGKNNGHGAIRLQFTLARPPNDDRASALAIGTGAATNIEQTGATQEAGEVLRCGGSDYAGTVWFRYTAAEAVDAHFTASADFRGAANPSDTVMAVYRAGEGAPVACNDDGATAAGPSELSLRLSPGEYFVQVGARGTDTPALGTGTVALLVADRDRDRDGALQPADCDDGNVAIRPGAMDVPEDGVDQDCSGTDAVNLDRDADGFRRPNDCRDDRADINPGRLDIPGDATDQDCREGPAPFTVVPSGITAFFAVDRSRSTTRVTELSVRNVLAGTSVTVSCAGRAPRCPFKRTVWRFARARKLVDVRRPLRGVRLRPRVRLRVEVAHPGFIGIARTWRIRRAKTPVRTDHCRPPRAKELRRCPR